MVVHLWCQWEADQVIVEANGIGRGLFQELSAMSRSHFLGDSVQDPKIIRFESNVHLLYADTGEAALPRSAPWLGALLAELRGFPGGRHDDQVDSVVLFLNWLRSGRGRYLIQRANRRPAVNVVTGQRRHRRRLNDSLNLLRRNGYPW